MLLEIIAIALVVIFTIAAAILLIPVDITLKASKADGSVVNGVALRWIGITLWRSGNKKQKQEPKKRTAGFDIQRALRLLPLLWDAAPALAGIARGFWRGTRLRRLSIDLALGTGDPADTAILAGYLWSLAWIIDLVPRVTFSLHPDMERARLDGSVDAELRVRLLPIMVALLMAFTKRPFRLLLREVRR